MAKLLIIDNQRGVRNVLKEKLQFEGYETEAVENTEQAASLAENPDFDVVIIDEKAFNGLSSPEALPPSAAVIVTCENPSLDSALDAMRKGCFDLIRKPIDMNELLASLKRATSDASDNPDCPVPVRKNTATRAKVRKQAAGKVENIIGNSRQITHVKSLIDKVAPSDARVLITGPNGTGKELVAHWLHEKSERRDAPFVEVNCAAIPSELIESELFGHEKGAFTSAVKQRRGKFEQANGGTLFLDEIGDMSHSAQAKVLRALQENRICRVGSDKDVEVDVRIICATNKNLRDEIRLGNFREDLFHRLSVIVITVPPLSDRLEDIPLLVEYFVEKISGEKGINTKHVDERAIEELKSLDWTGNIRELRNVVERLIILSGDQITLEDVRNYALSPAW
ncbi:MAG: sigma-54 dependent transcriptional regulator [Alistipes sp.]|nr:sigma-54 dependent transcriptional regulator [Alistipes sp.]